MNRGVLLLAGAGLVGGILYLVEARRYPFGTAAEPGPGLYPVLVGILLLVASAGVGLEAVFKERAGEARWPQGRALWRVLAIVAANLGYAVALPYLGHPIAGTLVAFVILQVMGLQAWPTKIVLALGAGLGSQYLFASILGLPLPLGIWAG